RVLLQQRPIDCLRTSPVAGLFQSARFVEECLLVRRRRNKRKTSSERIPTHHHPKALGGAPPPGRSRPPGRLRSTPAKRRNEAGQGAGWGPVGPPHKPFFVPKTQASTRIASSSGRGRW